jgi:hypothetical protein
MLIDVRFDYSLALGGLHWVTHDSGRRWVRGHHCEEAANKRKKAMAIENDKCSDDKPCSLLVLAC